MKMGIQLGSERIIVQFSGKSIAVKAALKSSTETLFSEHLFHVLRSKKNFYLQNCEKEFDLTLRVFLVLNYYIV